MKTLITIIYLVSITSVFGQDITFKASNFKDNKEAYKIAKSEFDKGSVLFETGKLKVFATQDPSNDFELALIEFQKAYAFNPNSSELNFKLGVCFAHSSYKEKSISYLKKSFELNPEIDPFMNYYMGFVYQLAGHYKKALTYYKTFESEYRKADDFVKHVKKRKKECQFAIDITQKPVRAWVDNVTGLNSSNNDFAPSITMDGEELVLTSDRPDNNQPNERGNYDNDIYTSSFEKGKWLKPVKALGGINSDKNEISNCFSYDGTKMLICKINDLGNYDIYETFLQGEKWSEPISFSRNINLKSNDMYASYSADDVYIYYAKANPGGNTGYDIYISGVMNRPTRKYGTPNKVMNSSSPFNDGPIYLHPDGKTMYFASEGFNSIGGFDIFESNYDNGSWSKPINMGYPINTPYDDFFFSASANGKYAYITSNRAGGKGGNDIYQVTFWGEEKSPSLSVEDYLLASINQPINDPELAIKVKVKKSINLTVFKGKTIDNLSKKPVEALIEITDNSTGNIIKTFTTNSATGKFLISLKSGKNYGIAVKANGYMFHSENFDIAPGSAYNLVNKTIVLKNVKIGNTVTLRNIFFDIGKANLRTESYAELNRLIKLLNDVPSLKIEISGHTDNTGSISGNKTLSQKRAEAVVQHLLNKGISVNRLIAKGYGSDKPIASNKTESGRQENRRTEFKIIGN